jgi:hypothetical protein
MDRNVHAAQSIISAVPSAVTRQSEYQVMSGRRYILTIGTEEKKLGLVVKIYDLLFNTRGLTRDEEIDDGLQEKQPISIWRERLNCARTYVDVFFEANSRIRIESGSRG